MAVMRVVVRVRGGRVVVAVRRIILTVGVMAMSIFDGMGGRLVVAMVIVAVIRRWMLLGRMVIRRGMRGRGVVPVRIGMAVVVVRLVLVAHLGLVPSRCSAVFAAKSV